MRIYTYAYTHTPAKATARRQFQRMVESQEIFHTYIHLHTHTHTHTPAKTARRVSGRVLDSATRIAFSSASEGGRMAGEFLACSMEVRRPRYGR